MDAQELVRNYSTPQEAKELVEKMQIALIVGIAAAGKDSFLKILLQSGRYARIITTVPREPRPGEVDGVNYYFIDDEKARQNLLEQKYFETKMVHGRVYGTTTAELERIAAQDKIALGDVDVQGVDEYHRYAKKLTAIFIIPPDFATWLKRWQMRGDTGDKEEVKRRMISAEEELDFALKANYYYFVVNDDLEESARIADELIQKGAEFSYDDQSARQMAEKLHDDIVAYVGGEPHQFDE